MPIDITNLKSQLQTRLNALTEDSTIEDVLLLSKTINQFVGDGVDYTNFRAVLQSQVDNLTPSSPIKDILLISKSLESSASSITTSDILLTGNNQIAYITSFADGIRNDIQSIYQDDISLKANLASPTFTGTVSGITKTMVGLGSVDNTADSAKNVLSATKLSTARTIGGVDFDGSTNIDLPGVNRPGNQDTTGAAARTSKFSAATWVIEEINGALYFSANGVMKAKLDASGNLTVVGNVTAYGTI